MRLKKSGFFWTWVNGLGKTVTTLTAIRELKYNRFQVKKVLVIAPKKVAEGTWTKEKDKWDHTKILRVSPVLGSQTKRIRALNTPADIYIINRENVCWLVDYYRNSWPFDMVVIDESSSFKSHKAKRFKSLASVGTHIDRIVELTGTPSPNGLEDLWARLRTFCRTVRRVAHTGKVKDSRSGAVGKPSLKRARVSVGRPETG